jgi:hypothetical protein
MHLIIEVMGRGACEAALAGTDNHRQLAVSGAPLVAPLPPVAAARSTQRSPFARTTVLEPQRLNQRARQPGPVVSRCARLSRQHGGDCRSDRRFNGLFKQ